MAQEDYFSDSPEGMESAPAAEEAAGNSDTSGQTAVLPASFFPPEKELTPGNECTIRIEKAHDDSVEVSYVTEHAGEEEMPVVEEELTGGGPPATGGSMDEMMY